MFDPAIDQSTEVVCADSAEVAALKALMYIVLGTLFQIIETQKPGSAMAVIDEASTECQVQLMTATTKSSSPLPAKEIDKVRRRSAHLVKEMLEPLKERFAKR